MSKTNAILKAGHVMQGNNTQKLLGYCNRLNNELGFNITTTSGGYVLRDSSYATRLVEPLNEFQFGLREGNSVNDTTMNKFIERVQNENPYDRPIDYSDLKDFNDYQFSKWARTNNGVYNELTTRINSRTLEQYKKTYPKNIIHTIIRILNEHNFASNDNIHHKYVRRIYQESLDHFTNRVYPQSEGASSDNNIVPPSQTEFGSALQPSAPFFRFGAAETFPELNPLNALRRRPPNDSAAGLGFANETTPIIDNTNINNNNNTFLFQNQMAQEVDLQDLVNAYNSFAQHPVDINTIANNVQEIQRIAIESINHFRHRPGRVGGPKQGMNALWDIVLDNKKDIKRRRKAMTLAGAQDIVNKRNAANPNSQPWSVSDEDVNGDNIPDIIIKNGSNNPIYINGYTTAKSDWPARFHFYTDYDAAARKQYRNEHGGKSITVPIYLKEKLNYNYNNDLNGNPHHLGEMTGYTMPEAWRDYKLDGYSFVKEKRKNAFARFRDYVVSHVVEDVINALRTQNILDITPKFKARLIMMATSKLWKHYILSTVARKRGFTSVEHEEFKKWCKKSEGKRIVDAEVSSLLLHVLHTNGNHWTAEQRAQLRNKIYNDFGHAMVESAQEVNERERENLIHDRYTGQERQGMQYDHRNDEEGGEWHDGITQEYNREQNGEWDLEDDEAFLN